MTKQPSSCYGESCVWGIAFVNCFDHFFPLLIFVGRGHSRSCVFYYHILDRNVKSKTIWNMKSFQLFDFDWKLLYEISRWGFVWKLRHELRASRCSTRNRTIHGLMIQPIHYTLNWSRAFRRFTSINSHFKLLTKRSSFSASVWLRFIRGVLW